MKINRKLINRIDYKILQENNSINEDVIKFNITIYKFKRAISVTYFYNKIKKIINWLSYFLSKLNKK